MDDSVSQTYASALFSLCRNGDLQAYREAMQEIEGSFESNPDFLRLLSSYRVELKEKERLIDTVYGSMDLPHLTGFLKTLCKNHRIGGFADIHSAFRSLVNEVSGVKEGIAYSASPLSQEQLSSIEAALSKKLGAAVELKNLVDHTLLGGVKVALDGKVYDGSLRSRLFALKKHLSAQ